MEKKLGLGTNGEKETQKTGILAPVKSAQSFFAARVNNLIELTDTLVLSRVGVYLPAFIFVTSVAVSSILRMKEYRSTKNELTNQLDAQLLDIIYPIQSRIKSYEQILYGVHGLFYASKEITRSEFKSYLDSLQLKKNFPEIPGVSIAYNIKGADIHQHIATIQAEGFGEYGKDFEPGKVQYAPVVYIEPFAGENLKAFGFDNFSCELRSEIFKTAQRENRPMLSRPLTIRQDQVHEHNNFLMTFPIHSKMSKLDISQHGNNNIVGWASLVFRMDELIKVMNDTKLDKHAVKIYFGNQEDEEKLLYSSFTQSENHATFHLKRAKTIPVLNAQWTFVIYSSKMQEKIAYHEGYLDNIQYSGIFITVLLTILAYGFIKTRLETHKILQEQQDAIQKLETLTQDMKHLAIHDPLTNLPNRVGFLEQFRSLISLADRHHSKVAFMFVDLDKFKYVNDNYGHPVGDQLLIEVTKRMKRALRSEDVIGRQGGDEFFIAIGDFKEVDVAAKVAGKIIQALKAPFLIDGHEIYIGSSIGIAMFPDDSRDMSELQKYADLAMYSVKGNGRNGYHFYTDSMQKDAEEYNLVSNALRNAIEKKEFSMVYQPVVDARTGEIASMEALIRWTSKDLGVVSPAKFIPIAESDLQNIEAIGNWTLSAVCDQINEWKIQGKQVPRIAVNLSARQFLKKTFQEDLLKLINQKNIQPHEIALEITEGALFKDIDSAVAMVNTLSQLGFTILIDDFGTGYSNLVYISKFSAGIIKIDKSFIAMMEQTENSQIIKLIITLAHSLGMKVIAEGVEELHQYEYLQSLECDYIQGYYAGHPATSQEIFGQLKKMKS